MGLTVVFEGAEESEEFIYSGGIFVTLSSYPGEGKVDTLYSLRLLLDVGCFKMRNYYNTCNFLSICAKGH